MLWVEAARIGRRPNGEVFVAEVFMQYGRPMTLDAAIEKAKTGKTVFVNRADAPAVVAGAALDGAEGLSERRECGESAAGDHLVQFGVLGAAAQIAVACSHGQDAGAARMKHQGA